MLAGIVQIKVHLSGIGVAELADLEVDDQQGFEPAVEKQQVDSELGVVQLQTALAADEGEVVAEFQQEIGQMLDQRLFEIGFGVFVLEVEKLQDERVLDGLLGRDDIARFGVLGFPEQGSLVARQRDAFVELAVAICRSSWRTDQPQRNASVS